MEHLSRKLTDYILNAEIITEDSYDIYQYGFQCFLEVSASTVCSIIIAIILHMLPECLFFFLFFIPMRSYSGGLHLKTYLSCFIGSCLILTSALLAVKYFTIPLFVSFVLYVLSNILIIFIGPVNHPNREVSSQDNLTFTRRTYLTVFLSFVVTIYLFLTENTKYMFLLALIFMLVSITALIGNLLRKHF